MTTSITNTPMIATLWLIAFGTAVMVGFTHRRTRYAVVTIAGVLVLLAAASSVNGYFDYIPTVVRCSANRAPR